MEIPKLIHQTWKDLNVPDEFRQLSCTWKQKHEDWRYCFWTDEMNRNFIKTHFPYFLNRYDNYPSNIQRVDAIRYFLLYKFGGVYIDLDFECKSCIDPLLYNAQCVFGKEPEEHCSIHNKEFIISNAFMATVPGHPFFALLCSELRLERKVIDHRNNNILESTGPFMLSRMYSSYEKKEEIKLLNAELIYPLTKEELYKLESDKTSIGEIAGKLNKAYAVHYYAGTWWKPVVEHAHSNKKNNNE